jgi:hypothetical protein
MSIALNAYFQKDEITKINNLRLAKEQLKNINTEIIKIGEEFYQIEKHKTDR